MIGHFSMWLAPLVSCMQLYLAQTACFAWHGPATPKPAPQAGWFTWSCPSQWSPSRGHRLVRTSDAKRQRLCCIIPLGPGAILRRGRDVSNVSIFKKTSNRIWSRYSYTARSNRQVRSHFQLRGSACWGPGVGTGSYYSYRPTYGGAGKGVRRPPGVLAFEHPSIPTVSQNLPPTCPSNPIPDSQGRSIPPESLACAACLLTSIQFLVSPILLHHHHPLPPSNSRRLESAAAVAAAAVAAAREIKLKPQHNEGHYTERAQEVHEIQRYGVRGTRYRGHSPCV